MKVFVRDAAEEDIIRLFAWITKDNPAAAADAVSRIREQINRLETDSLTEMGHPGLLAGTRELLEGPYIIVYKIYRSRGEIVILSVVHGARHR